MKLEPRSLDLNEIKLLKVLNNTEPQYINTVLGMADHFGESYTRMNNIAKNLERKGYLVHSTGGFIGKNPSKTRSEFLLYQTTQKGREYLAEARRLFAQ